MSYAAGMGPFRREGLIRTRRTRLLPLGALCFLLIPTLTELDLCEHFIHTSPGWMLFLSVGIVLVTSAIPALLFARFPKVRRGTLTVDAGNVLLDGQPVIARSELRYGWRQTMKGRATALLQPRLGVFPHEVELPSDADVDAFLAATRLDRRHRVSRVGVLFGESRRALLRLVLPMFIGLPVLFALTVLALAAPSPSWMSGSLVGLIAAVYVSVMFLLGIESVKLGSDGLLLGRSFFRKRFVSYAAIAHVEVEAATVRVRLTTDEVVVMSFPLNPEGARHATDLAGAIEQARAEHATAPTPNKTTALLGRNGRPPREWMDALGRLVDDSSSYRVPALAPEQLWSIVEDRAAPPTARAGAAFALRTRIDDGGREQLRIVTDACAAPKLRVALEAAASSNEDALASALAEIEEDGAAQARART